MLAIFLFLAACARHIPKPYITPGNPLARVEIGMDPREVASLLGAPTDQRVYVTGKSFIPFYFGTDSVETVFHYRALGRVVFANGPIFLPRVIRIEEDENEPGFYRQQR